MSTEHHEWAVDMPRQRKIQYQTAEISLRNQGHREVIFDDYYHSAIFDIDHRLSSWMQMPYKAIVLETVYGSSRCIGLIDLSHKYVHASNYSRSSSMRLRKNTEYSIVTSGSSSIQFAAISKEGCEWQTIASTQGRDLLANNDSGNNYRFADNLIARSWRDGSSVPFYNVHFSYLEPKFDEETGELLDLEQHILEDFNTSSRLQRVFNLTWTKNGALYAAQAQSEDGMRLIEVTPNHTSVIGHLTEEIYEYGTIGTSRIVQSPSGMCAYCFAKPEKITGESLYNVNIAFWYSYDYGTWQSLILNDEPLKAVSSSEFKTLIIHSEGLFYVYVMEYTSDTSHYIMHLYIVSETLSVVEVELPHYIDVPFDDEFKGPMVDDIYSGNSVIRIILDKTSDDYENPFAHNFYIADAFMDDGSLPHNTGWRSISYTDGKIDAERPPFMILGRFDLGSGHEAYVYIDNLRFQDGKNFFFVTKAMDTSEAGQKVSPNDYVF